MVVKNGKCRLVGFVDLGRIHDDMQKLSGTKTLNYTSNPIGNEKLTSLSLKTMELPLFRSVKHAMPVKHAI